MPFAICIRTPVDSRTCDTLPGADPTLSLYMVCILSIMTIWGFLRSITLRIVSRFVSHNNSRLSVKVPIRSARILIWCKDSSPDTYSTDRFWFDRFLHTCSNSVDLPIPGSPPTRTREPRTIPPPSTRSSSFIEVLVLSSSFAVIAESGTGFASVAGLSLPEVLSDFRSTSSSTKVFHSLHPGHCPIHFADSYPQF